MNIKCYIERYVYTERNCIIKNKKKNVIWKVKLSYQFTKKKKNSGNRLLILLGK